MRLVESDRVRRGICAWTSSALKLVCVLLLSVASLSVHHGGVVPSAPPSAVSASAGAGDAGDFGYPSWQLENGALLFDGRENDPFLAFLSLGSSSALQAGIALRKERRLFERWMSRRYGSAPPIVRPPHLTYLAQSAQLLC